MSKTSVTIKITFFYLLLSSFIFSGMALASDAKPMVKDADKVAKLLQETVLAEAQRSFDRSLNFFNIVITATGILIAIVATFGVLKIRKQDKELEKAITENKEKAKELFERINEGTMAIDRISVKSERQFEKSEKLFERTESKIEKSMTALDEKVAKAEKLVEQINIIRNNLEKDIDRDRPEIKKDVSQPLSEKLSPAVEAKLAEFTRRLEFLEVFGAELKPEDYFAKSTDFYNKGDYELAIVALDKAIELKPDFAEAWFNKGFLLDKLDRYNKALEAYEKAISLKPDFRAWNNKGIVLSKVRRFDDAIMSYSKAIELKPESGELWFNRAGCYCLKGDKKNALSDLKEAIRLKTSLKDEAKKDKDFESIWGDEDFKKVVE